MGSLRISSILSITACQDIVNVVPLASAHLTFGKRSQSVNNIFRLEHRGQNANILAQTYEYLIDSFSVTKV